MDIRCFKKERKWLRWRLFTLRLVTGKMLVFDISSEISVSGIGEKSAWISEREGVVDKPSKVFRGCKQWPREEEASRFSMHFYFQKMLTAMKVIAKKLRYCIAWTAI